MKLWVKSAKPRMRPLKQIVARHGIRVVHKGKDAGGNHIYELILEPRSDGKKTDVEFVQSIVDQDVFIDASWR